MKLLNPYYIKRINKAIDFLEENLDRKLSLEEVANEAMFSKFHFHRIFKAVTNETLNNYIKRLKLERACRILVAGTDDSITELAYKLGYHSVTGFSRDFQEFYGVSPSYVKTTKQRPTERVIDLSKEIDLSFLEVETLPEFNVLYQRVADGYNPPQIQKAFSDLYEFAVSNKLVDSISQVIGVGYDDPDFTPANKCRYDACIIFNEKHKLSNDLPFNRKVIKGGDYALFSFTGKAKDFHTAWDVIFKDWLVNSNYLPDDKPHMEMYLPSEHFEDGILKANLCLPVLKL